MQVIDVTLRDGGNRNNFHFTMEDLQNILPALDASGVDFIEIGYRNGAIRPGPDIGWAGMCRTEYLAACRALVRRAKLAVMVHPENVSAQDLAELKAHGVSLIRICVTKSNITASTNLVTLCHAVGLPVSLNFIHMSHYTLNELVKAVETVSSVRPSMIYFADSNGSMLPERVEAAFTSLTQRYSFPFGYHAHDNLGMAQANTLAALEAGAQFVDFALGGMGKGIGNLRTEFFVAYLHACGNRSYELAPILAAANYIRKRYATESVIEMDEFTRGISDLSTAQVKNLTVKAAAL